ncbi:16S rRNA (adenine(1518)-N(6)/adenine(1519)-N(6))-dimethyltransferase RsmA [Caulifigura coniformis]|nr:16S rRNA (adenine(1518)-N(6)/adenine(1519)-N(6))-dimethyltransferase RsmA [Caulifigura coniformis]
MSEPPRQTRSYLMSLFERHSANPRHDLGQNFLIDLNLHDYIVAQAGITPDDVVLEVGTGTGALTSAIAKDADRVITVEYDRRVHEIAKELLQSRPQVTLLNCDVLKNKNRFNPDVIEAVTAALDARPAGSLKSLKLVANLPYNVATPVMSNLIATELPWRRMVVTIQYELAERMAAAPGSSQYSALTVWLQAQTKVTLLKKLGPNVFWPRPQVDSAIVRIDPDLEARNAIADREFLHTFLRDVFTQRRKRLRGVVASMFKATHDKPAVDAAFELAGVSAESRAEDLPPADLVRLSNALAARSGPRGDR